MFVRPAARGHGVGRKLCERLIERARELGYAPMKLDALHCHRGALPLYRSLGFVADRESPSFGDDFVVPMVLDLRPGGAG
ncbi:MAG: GNAT family N-acetyltransferase [Paracoccaceae bacterium]